MFQRDLNITFILNYEALFERIGNNFYLLIVFSTQNLNNWVLGKPFFKKYQLIFEPDKKNTKSLKNETVCIVKKTSLCNGGFY